MKGFFFTAIITLLPDISAFISPLPSNGLQIPQTSLKQLKTTLPNTSARTLQTLPKNEALAPFTTTHKVTTTSQTFNHFSSALFSTLQPDSSSDSSSPDSSNPPTSKTLTSRLSKFASLAALLCALDCTVLPLLSLLLPFLSFLPPSLAFSHESLHKVSHAASIYFVLPVGSTAAILNFLTSKSKSPSTKYLPLASSLLGLFLILATNTPLTSLPILGSLFPSSLSHSLTCPGAFGGGGLKEFFSLHRVVNLTGAGMLIWGNNKGHKGTHEEGECCGHNHD